MKRPERINFFPLDIKKDADSDGLWFYVPKWVVRGYRLKNYLNISGRIKIVIEDKPRSPKKYRNESKLGTKYYLENWSKKLAREGRKMRKTLSLLSTPLGASDSDKVGK